jgi:mannan endo-1,4-beta-mannosidase
MNGQSRQALRAARKAGGAADSADSEGTGRHRQALSPRPGPPVRRRWRRWAAAVAVAGVAAAAFVVFAVPRLEGPATTVPSLPRDGSVPLPAAPGFYVGVYPRGVPLSYAGVTAFSSAAGIRPHIVLYYSGWLESFQAGFARTTAEHGAVPLVQINPEGTSLAAIASGQYDAYLSSYAEAVRAYRGPVILSFGHEMNGNWYSWGFRHTSPEVFVAAWRHIVDLFRGVGVRNVTWMWTVNVINSQYGVPSPVSWWPGRSYVTWIGIDGYYLRPSSTFVSVFGPTIAAVRALTRDPILVSETAAPPGRGQPEKIADLFAGVHLYGLLGFVWFDAVHGGDWRLNGPAAFATLRQSVRAYHMNGS